MALRPGLVLAVGPNGAGKTNLLEGLHVATQGFSPRTRLDANLIRFGTDRARVGVEGESGRGRLAIEVTLEPGARQARLNGSLLPSLDRLRAETAVLAFTPDRLAVVKAGPAVRRAYVDRTLARLLPARAGLPAAYAAAVVQRNAALRRVAARASSLDALAPWSEHVARLGEQLSASRAATIDTLSPGFAEAAGELGLADAGIAYDPSPAKEDALDACLSRDLERGTTGSGPHLDEIRLLAGGRDLRTHGSQGEQRVAVLALLLAEAALLAGSARVPPLLLLDDVLSELDGDRRAALVTRVRPAGQILVTATARAALPADPDLLLEVSPGRVRVS